MFAGLQTGVPDLALMNDDLKAYFTAAGIADYAASLKPLGEPVSFVAAARSERGGMTFRLFDVVFAKKTVEVWERIMPDGKIEQYQVGAK